METYLYYCTGTHSHVRISTKDFNYMIVKEYFSYILYTLKEPNPSVYACVQSMTQDYSILNINCNHPLCSEAKLLQFDRHSTEK